MIKSSLNTLTHTENTPAKKKKTLREISQMKLAGTADHIIFHSIFFFNEKLEFENIGLFSSFSTFPPFLVI